MSSDTGPVHATGHCYCGAIQFSVDLAAGERPVFTAYCHCDSCRRAHSAPLYHVVCVDDKQFSITAGADTLVEFQKPENAHISRAFCGRCGSRILNRFPGWKPARKTPIAFFPSLLEEEQQHALPEMFLPEKTNRPEECVLDRAFLQRFFNEDKPPPG